MSTTETTPPKPAKAPWVRCKGSGRGASNGCRQRVFNDPIDIELHQQHCPADLERDVTALEKRIEKLEKAEPVVLPEQVDLDDIADDWPDADQAAPATPAQEPANAEPADDQDDDWDDEDDVDNAPAPPIGAALYTPGNGPL